MILILSEIFRGSKYEDSAFTQAARSAVEAMIFTKTQRGKDVPYIRCIIRDKEIHLTPEEAVRQLYVYTLIHEYGYEPGNIKLEHAIHFGREVKRADIVIFGHEHTEAPYIIVEVKKPSLTEGKGQLKSYCNASGAMIGVWTNGQSTDCYHRKAPNIFERIDDIPRAGQTIYDIQKRITIAGLEKRNILRDGKKTLKTLIQELEDDVLASAGVDAFEEVFKLIFTKLYDELQSTRDEKRYLEFRQYKEEGEDDDKAEKRLSEKIQALFNMAKDKWPFVFKKDDRIELTPSHLAVCVSELQNVKLFNSNLEVIDDAFEYLMSKSQKGEKGQYFTPRYVIDMCVKMLNPQEHESMIDTAAGSCGFPVHTIFHVWGQIYDRLGLTRRDMFTAEKKPPACIDYVTDKIFAIDFDPKAVRVARTLNLIAGDGHTNVLHLNTLDYGNWEEVVKAEEWIDTYNDGWKGLRKLRALKGSNRDFMFDIVMANPPFAGDIKEGKIISRYELAKDAKGKYVSKIGRDILFIERNLQFLKPGGRMAIILPQGRFNNSSDKYIREFIASQCRILAVIGLHENVFKPHTGTKTSVLLVQKWDEELCPRREDYPVFFATMRKPGKDNSGEKVYVKDEGGNVVRDSHFHPVVSHDLYNHEGLTGDGIAEAFIEFAKREGLSFFGDARFDGTRYGELMSGLEVSEVMLSWIRENTYDFRIESEFYRKDDVNTLRKLQAMKHALLGEGLVSLVTDGTHFTPQYVDEGLPFLSALNIKRGYIDFEAGCQHITQEQHEILCRRVRPQEGDILMRKIGTGERLACVVPKLEHEFSIFVSVALIRASISPYYLSAFINSKYGQMQLLRFNKGINQPDLHLEDIRRLLVPLFSDEFYGRITDITLKAQSLRVDSESLYTQAQTLLTDSIGHVPQDPRNITTVSFSQAFSTGRLDAEYFMPKYTGYERAIAEYPNGSSTVRELFSLMKTSCSRTEESYRYAEIGDIDISTGTANPNTISTPELPDNAKIMTMAGDILVSKVRPNRGAVAILEDDNILVSGAFAVLRGKTDYRREVLHVLLRSEMYKSWLLRFNVGTSYPVIKDEDVLNMPVPLFPPDTQQAISDHVKRSFSLRKESQRLISLAVKAVETAVEYDENTALIFLAKEYSPS